MGLFLPSIIPFPLGLLRRSLRRADFSERMRRRRRRRRPTFRSFTRRGRRRDGGTSERRYPSQYITVTALAAVAVPSLLRMRGWGVKRRWPFARSEQESSLMTKWKVRPTERKRRRSKAGRARLERERRRGQAPLVGWLGLSIEGSKTRGTTALPHSLHTEPPKRGKSGDFFSASVYLLDPNQQLNESLIGAVTVAYGS